MLLLALVLGLSTAAPPQVSAELCRMNAPVEVLWEGRWWSATVNAPAPVQGRCPIHYDGYDASWDEVVTADRIRGRASGRPSPSVPSAPPPAMRSAAYTHAVECVGLIGRMANTTGASDVKAELVQIMNRIAATAFQLGESQGPNATQVQQDFGLATRQAETVIPTTNQEVWQAAMRAATPRAEQCLEIGVPAA